MTALSSKSAEWQTPPWLLGKISQVTGPITLDAATSADNPVNARFFLTKELDALTMPWRKYAEGLKGATLFLNPPGSTDGKLVRAFWAKWDVESRWFASAAWVGFNLDQLRFVCMDVSDALIIPRKRIAYVDPTTKQERKGAQIGSFILLRGQFRGIEQAFPSNEYNYA